MMKLKIDCSTYKISDKNYYPIETEKSQIVISNTLRLNSNHLIRLKYKDFGNSKMWPNYTVSRDGTIYEHFNPKYYSDYIDILGVNKKIISITIENMGFLCENNDGEFVNWIGEVCDSKLVMKKKWLSYLYWEEHTKKQLNACSLLCKKLSNEYNIKNDIIDFTYYHKDIKNFNGIVYKSNYFENSGDHNPFLKINNKIYQDETKEGIIST